MKAGGGVESSRSPSSIAVSGFISGGDIGDINPGSMFSHCMSSSTLGVVEGVASGCRKLEGCEEGIDCCWCGAGVNGQALLISAVTDIVGLSFFATLDMTTHKHPHITRNSLHSVEGFVKTAQIRTVPRTM